MVGHDLLDELVLLIQHHIVDIMTKVAFSASVTGLATAVAGLHNGFEGLSAVDIHRNARGKCMRVNLSTPIVIDIPLSPFALTSEASDKLRMHWDRST
jgi:hypothetical protein